MLSAPSSYITRTTWPPNNKEKSWVCVWMIRKAIARQIVSMIVKTAAQTPIPSQLVTAESRAAKVIVAVVSNIAQTMNRGTPSRVTVAVLLLAGPWLNAPSAWLGYTCTARRLRKIRCRKHLLAQCVKKRRLVKLRVYKINVVYIIYYQFLYHTIILIVLLQFIQLYSWQYFTETPYFFVANIDLNTYVVMLQCHIFHHKTKQLFLWKFSKLYSKIRQKLLEQYTVQTLFLRLLTHDW